MITLWRSDRDDDANRARPRRKQLPSRNLVEEQLSPQARLARGQIDGDVFGTAVTIENRVIDPSTGLQRTNGNRTPEASFVSACEDMILECRNWIRKQCGPDDADSLQCTNDALEAATPAIDMMQNLEMALEENVQDPRGGRSPIRVVMANHRSDQMLAADREREGDNRHLDRPVARAWIAVAAGVFAVLDMLLLWRPVLHLAALDSARMLLQWVIAGALSAATALFIEITVRHFQRAERNSTDRRDAVRDRNRAVHSDNHSAFGAPSLDPSQIDTADAELRSAGGWLLGAAVATAVIGAARVAYLARISNLSVVEAALFAVVAALFLGGLVVLMGFLSCRGNRLGDRLGIATGIVEAVEQRDRECRENVADAQERARRLLVTADQATARGDETRAWVIEGYLRSMMLARDWCDLDTSVFDGVQPRFNASSRPLAEQATGRKREALAVLEKIGKWLEKPQGVVERLRGADTVRALPPAPRGAPAGGRIVAPPQEDEETDVKLLADSMPEEPRISRWLMALGAAAAVATAVVIAVVTAPPEGESDRQVTGSAPVRSTAVTQPPASLVWAGSVAVTS